MMKLFLVKHEYESFGGIIEEVCLVRAENDNEAMQLSARAKKNNMWLDRHNVTVEQLYQDGSPEILLTV